MKWLSALILLISLGCTTSDSSYYRMTESGYPAVHRNDYVYRNNVKPFIQDMYTDNYTTYRNNIDNCRIRYYEVHKCHHIKEPTYQYRFIPPVYKPIFLGVDEEGHDIYERMLITGGYYEKIFVGYRCYHCGVKL